MSRHTWTDEDDQTLRTAVKECLPLRETFASTRGHAGWWATVIGRSLLPVSPEAARARWERLDRDRRAAEAGGPAKDAAWERVATEVEAYEQSVNEATLETVTESAAVLRAFDSRLGRVEELALGLERIERLMTALCRAWDVTP